MRLCTYLNPFANTHKQSPNLSPLTEVKATHEVGLKSAPAWGCTSSINFYSNFKDLKSAPNPSSTLLLSLLLLISPFFNNWRTIHCHWGGRLYFRVDYEIRWCYSQRGPMPPVSLWIQTLISTAVDKSVILWQGLILCTSHWVVHSLYKEITFDLVFVHLQWRKICLACSSIS